MRYRYSVLLLFVLLEVLLFSAPRGVQAVVSVAEYLFVAFTLFLATRIGLMYFISFSLLSMGAWTYVLPDLAPANFWGLRAFGLSVNGLFTAAVAVLFLAAPNLRARSHSSSFATTFLASFVVYSFVVGIIAVLLSVNHGDNFLNDISIYTPYLVYLYLVSRLDIQSIAQIGTYGVSLTVVSMLLSWLMGIRFAYAQDAEFVLMNGFAFIVVFVVFFVKDLYSRSHYYFLVGSVLVLLTANAVFLGGKSLIVLAGTAAWGLLHSRRAIAATFLVALALWTFRVPILSLLPGRLPEGALVLYKVDQIQDVIEIQNIERLSETRTSMGNIAAEGRTIFEYLSHRPVVLLFGKGFGGGVPDQFGYLTPLAGQGGYAEHDASRNEFVRMHLPLYEIVLKAGLVGLVGYLALLLQLVRSSSIYSFTSFVLLASVFTNTKEMMLLTLVFLLLAGHPPSEMAKEHGKARRGLTSPPVAA